MSFPRSFWESCFVSEVPTHADSDREKPRRRGIRGGNGGLSRRLLLLLALFGCLLDGLLRFLHHSHLLWFVLSPRRQVRRRQVTERTIVVIGSEANGIKVTRERWVAQSIAKRIRISRKLSIVFACEDVNLTTKTPRHKAEPE